MYAPALQRGRCLVLEDAPALGRVPVTLRVPEQIRSASLPLTGEELTVTRGGDSVSVVVPEVNRHQIVEFRY
jgi:hypothetical protein